MGTKRVVRGLMGLVAVMACAAAQAGVSYQLGPETELLDAAFYAGQPEDGSDVAGRMGFFGATSHDGRRVAFWAVNKATFLPAIFIVDIGAPGSWRRLSPDGTRVPDHTIYWSPDDSAVTEGSYWFDVATGTSSPALPFGWEHENIAVSALPANNWMVGCSSIHPAVPGPEDGRLVAIPILPNGLEDLSRQPVILADLAYPTEDIDWPNVTGDLSSVTFMITPALYPAPDHEIIHVYAIPDLQAILNAPKVPGTDLSTLAPTSLADPRIVPIRVTNNCSVSPYYSQDKQKIIFAEDWSQLWRSGAYFFSTMAVSDFDIMIADSGGSGEPFRLATPGNQAVAVPTPGGTRITYTRNVGDTMHFCITTLEVMTDVTGTVVGDPADNDVIVTSDQEASDTSGTTVEIPTGTTVDFPPAVPQQVTITTPIDPATDPQLPPNIEAVPVIREFGPEGTTFNPAITVTISYTDAEVEGLDEANLRVLLYNEATGIYDIEVTTVTERDLDNNTISFAVDHFSTFALGAPADTDGDGLANDLDPDDDNDGIADAEDAMPLDTDNDGEENDLDNDDDSDGLPDLDDADPLDTDNDGTPNATDADDDADGIADAEDAFPYDTDNDGQRNDVDADDDGDTLDDADEATYGTDPLVADSDGDSVDDGSEVAAGTDPMDPESNPLPLPLIPTAVLLGGAILATALRHLRRR